MAKSKKKPAAAAEINLRSPAKAGLILVGDFSPTSRGLGLGVGGGGRKGITLVGD